MKFLEEFAPLAGRSHLQVLSHRRTRRTTASKELADAGAPSGAAVIADRQTAGRGRLGRSFLLTRGRGAVSVASAAPDAAGRPADDRSGACRRGGGAGSAPCGRARLRHQVAERPRLRGAQGQRHSDRARPDAERPRRRHRHRHQRPRADLLPPTRRRSRGISTRGRIAP